MASGAENPLACIAEYNPQKDAVVIDVEAAGRWALLAVVVLFLVRRGVSAQDGLLIISSTQCYDKSKHWR